MLRCQVLSYVSYVSIISYVSYDELKNKVNESTSVMLKGRYYLRLKVKYLKNVYVNNND